MLNQFQFVISWNDSFEVFDNPQREIMKSKIKIKTRSSDFQTNEDERTERAEKFPKESLISIGV